MILKLLQIKKILYNFIYLTMQKYLYSSSSTDNLTASVDQHTILYKQHKPRNPQNLINPYVSHNPLKFPKKHIRKQSQTTMLTQTSENQPRSSIKNFPYKRQSNVLNFGLTKQKYIRKRNPGTFCKWASQTGEIHQFSSSVDCIITRETLVSLSKNKGQWVSENRKGLVGKTYQNPDPILVGKVSKQTRTYLEKIEKQARRHRDNGNRIRDKLIWDKVKPKGYLQKYRACKKMKTQVS